jgi:hypothetical protein
MSSTKSPRKPKARIRNDAEAWQRAQAWATWEKIEAGDRRDVPMERFREHTARALAALDARSGRR